MCGILSPFDGGLNDSRACSGKRVRRLFVCGVGRGD